MNISRSNTVNNHRWSSGYRHDMDDEVWLKVDGRLCDVSNLVGRPHRQRSFSSLQSVKKLPPSMQHRRSKSVAEPSLYPSTAEMNSLFNEEERQKQQIKAAAAVLARRRRDLPDRGLGRSYSSCLEKSSLHHSAKQVRRLLETEEKDEVERRRSRATHHQYIKSRSLGGGAAGLSDHLLAALQDDSSLSSNESFAQDSSHVEHVKVSHSASARLSPQPTRHYVEVTPGNSIPMLSADETWKALQDNHVRDVSCAACLADLFVMNQATIVVCPTCRMLSPVTFTDATSDLNSAHEPCLGLGILQASTTLPVNRLEQRLLRKPPPRKYASLYRDNDGLGTTSCHSTSSARAA